MATTNSNDIAKHQHQFKSPEVVPGDNPTPRIDSNHLSPSLQTIGIQFLGICLAVFLNYLRKAQIPVLGWKLGIIGGIVPPECVVLSLLVLEMALRELGMLGR